VTRDTIPTVDGPMDVHLVRPEGAGPFPGVVVVQEAYGVNEHVLDVCARFAAAGYAALAPEIYHRSAAGLTVPYETPARAMAELGLLTNDGLEVDLAAALERLRNEDDVDPARVGLVGFCVGGFAAFLGACRLDPAATVSFYGGGIVRAREGMRLEPVLDEGDAIDTPLLALFGGEDASIPPADVAAIRSRLEQAGSGSAVHVYEGAKHAFFNDRRANYHEAAAADAWSRTLDWFGRFL
jgi:carboxymethylenebutenolidase